MFRLCIQYSSKFSWSNIFAKYTEITKFPYSTQGLTHLIRSRSIMILTKTGARPPCKPPGTNMTEFRFVKCVLVGDLGVGKSTFQHLIFYKTFPQYAYTPYTQYTDMVLTVELSNGRNPTSVIFFETCEYIYIYIYIYIYTILSTGGIRR